VIPSIVRVHIASSGHGDGQADWVVTLCGRTLSMQDHMAAWERAAENVSCAGCLSIYDANRRNVR
jgi:hypothetical protein